MRLLSDAPFCRRKVSFFFQYDSGSGESGEEIGGILRVQSIYFLGNCTSRFLYKQSQYVSTQQFLLSSRKTQWLYLASKFSYLIFFHRSLRLNWAHNHCPSQYLFTQRSTLLLWDIPNRYLYCDFVEFSLHDMIQKFCTSCIYLKYEITVSSHISLWLYLTCPCLW